MPITGTPSSLGDLVCRVRFSLDGEVKFEGEVQGSVNSSNELFRMGFDLFVWGGNYPDNRKGPGPNGSATAGKDFVGTEPSEPDVITAGSDGTNDVFKTMSEEYRINRGVEKWDGQRVYEHPGYVKLGVTNNGGWIMTPELEQLSAVPETVVVSVDFLRFDNEEGTYLVSAEGAGTVLNGKVDAAVLPTQSSAADRKWKTLSFTVQDATNKTRIKICAESLDGAGYRINIDNIVVMGSDETEVTEKLPAPDAGSIAYTPGDTSIAVAWEGVKGASSYEISLAARSNPGFPQDGGDGRSGLRVHRSRPRALPFHGEGALCRQCRIRFRRDIEERGNPRLRRRKAGRTGRAFGRRGDGDRRHGVVECCERSLRLPGFGRSGCGRRGCGDGSGAGDFLHLREIAGRYGVHGFCGGAGRRRGGRVRFGRRRRAARDDRPAAADRPSVRIFAKTHGLAVLEWELSSEALAQQPVTTSDTYDFRVKNAAGEVIRSVEAYKSFNFAKYRYYRLVWGGLAPSTTYTLEMRRRSTADAERYLDSEWAAVQVTTDADPAADHADCLLYADFERMPTGGQPLYGAYGFSYGATEDFSDPDRVDYTAPGDKNSIYCQAVKAERSYFDAYLPAWDLDDWTKNSSNMGMAAGYMKFGGGSKPAWLTLPGVPPG